MELRRRVVARRHIRQRTRGGGAGVQLSDIEKQLGDLRAEAESALPGAGSRDALEQLRVEYLGKKGKLTGVLRSMGSLTAAERPLVGKLANDVRDVIQALLESSVARLEHGLREQELNTRIDVTLPGRRYVRGRRHPLTRTSDDILEVLRGLGFERAEGPEIEHDFYNFEALNFPKNHPARDMQDTFYIDDDVVLRTHTSPVQVRTMLALGAPPVRVACFGRVYRNDHDNTHSPMFHQIEGLYVDKNVTFGDLKGTLEVFCARIFAPGVKVRLRPSFFPFTEPSAEVDMSCFACSGAGEVQGAVCRVCRGTGWIEIMGAGMVDPEVFLAAGFDPEQVTGFAFGIGVERVAMLRYGIDDIRLFFENDQRFLGQFR
jgi:phenylalanyl-tRNA synthetase alpha chain